MIIDRTLSIEHEFDGKRLFSLHQNQIDTLEKLINDKRLKYNTIKECYLCLNIDFYLISISL